MSSSGNVASVSNAAGSNGLASAAAIGTTSISAVWRQLSRREFDRLGESAGLAGLWEYNAVAANPAVLIMDASGNLTAFGLVNGAWFGYNGTVQISGSAVGNGGLGDCLNSGTISADMPALGIYTLTCTQAYDAANGVGVFKVGGVLESHPVSGSCIQAGMSRFP